MKSSREEEERQREADEHWSVDEVRALLVVWREKEAWEMTESRAKYEAISNRLKELGVSRDWLNCQKQSRAMALPEWRPPASQAQMDGSLLTKRFYEMEEGPSSPANRREGTSSLSNFQDGKYLIASF